MSSLPVAAAATQGVVQQCAMIFPDSVGCCAVLCSAVLCYAVLCCAVLCCAALRCAILPCPIRTIEQRIVNQNSPAIRAVAVFIAVFVAAVGSLNMLMAASTAAALIDRGAAGGTGMLCCPQSIVVHFEQ